MTTGDCVLRVRERLGGLLQLENVRPVCPGLVRAAQRLTIGGDVICTDEVLIEEAAYDDPDQMSRELASLTIKMGMYSPFDRRSTHPPKYCFPDEESVTALLVTSVPVVSLAMVLEEVNRRFPPRYTWDRIGFLRDRFAATVKAVRNAWEKTRNPVHIFKSVSGTLRFQQPQAIGRHERLQMAVLLALSLRQKHHAGLFHNNLSADTVLFADARTPRLLNNYAGVMSPLVRQRLPAHIRVRGPDSTFGDASADVYSLALLCYEVLLGERLDGGAFQLDDPQSMPQEPPRPAIRRPGGALRMVGPALGFIEEVWHQGRIVCHLLAAVFDESRWPRFRRLCRASGPLVYSLPWLGSLLCVVFPPAIARSLRVVLDREHNDAVFGPHSRHNRNSVVKRNADVDFLLAGLPVQWRRLPPRIAAVAQELIDRIKRRPLETADDDRPAVVATGWRRVAAQTVSPALLALSLLGCLLFASDRGPGPAGLHAEAAMRVREHDSRLAARRDRVPARESAGRDRSAPDQPPPAGALDREPSQDARSAQPAPPLACQAYLAPVRGAAGVYRIVNVSPACDLGDVLYNAPGDKVMNLRAIASLRTRYYVMKPRGSGFGPVVTARMCTRSRGSLQAGRFYVDLGDGVWGEPLAVDENDIFSFSLSAIKACRSQRR